MPKYIGEANFRHGTPDSLGILLANLGTPDAPTAPAVRRYLAEFLWDPRVIEVPRPLWWLILHGVILRIRPKRSAEAYSKVWTESGSPLAVITRDQAEGLQDRIGEPSLVVCLDSGAGNYEQMSLKVTLPATAPGTLRADEIDDDGESTAAEVENGEKTSPPAGLDTMAGASVDVGEDLDDLFDAAGDDVDAAADAAAEADAPLTSRGNS